MPTGSLTPATFALQEEDLSTNTCGFALCEDMTEEQVSASLIAEEEELQQQVKAWKAAATASKEESARGEEPQVARGEVGRDVAEGEGLEALLARVRLRRGWYAVVCHMSKGFKSLRSARKSIAYAQAQLALVSSVSPVLSACALVSANEGERARVVICVSVLACSV